MSRFSQLIDNLEDLQQQDIKNSAKVFGITATLSTRLQEILQDLEQSQKALPEGLITKEELIKRYGSYDRAYKAYQEAYGIKCKRGWNYFLAAIKGFLPPVSLEERVNKLEATVRMLVEILLKEVEEN